MAARLMRALAFTLALAATGAAHAASDGKLLLTGGEAQGIPFRTQNRLLALLAPMHREIVNVR